MQQKIDVTICLGSSCFSRGNKHILQFVKKYLSDKGLEGDVFFHGELCSGSCEKGPVLKIDGKMYEYVKLEEVESLLDKHLLK